MSKRRVLVVGAHPDDEVLGIGGTLARHVRDGDEVHALILCEGLSIRYPDAKDDFLAAEGRRAAEVLGLSSWTLHGFSDQKLDVQALSVTAAPIERKVAELEPQIVYTHWRGDINRDHRIAHEATLIATRCRQKFIESVYAYETPSETEWGIPYDFSPNTFVDITTTLETKLEAMACYGSQSPSPEHPRSLEHLRLRARYWGNCMLLEAAEPLVLLRGYWR
jgi:LmbE family N-acetylglucosaminyl deacetylase